MFPKSSVRSDSGLHTATGCIFLMCRLMGLFPVEGLLSRNSKRLRFNLKSPYSVLVCVSFLLMTSILCFIIHDLAMFGLNYNTMSYCIYMGEGFLRISILVWIAKSWPSLVSSTQAIETSLTSVRERNARFRLRVTVLTIFMLLLVVILYFVFHAKQSTLCNKKYYNNPNMTITQAFFEHKMPFVFYYIEYQPWIAGIFSIPIYQNFLSEYLFDMMIAYVSVYLTQYFLEFNERIVSAQNKPSLPWKEIRVHYTKMVSLVQLVDSKLSYMVILSLGSNLITICSLVFQILRTSNIYQYIKCHSKLSEILVLKALHFAYLCFTLLFIVTRTLIMTLSAAKLNGAAEKSAMFIYELPKHERSDEVQRLLSQINTTTVALTGLGFFNVTREMILSMTGVIITYELVLLQFARADDDDKPASSNNFSYI